MPEWKVRKKKGQTPASTDAPYEPDPSKVDLLRRLEDFTRLVSDWVWEADSDFRLTFVSFRVFEILGYHSLELVGRRLDDLGGFTGKDGAPADIDWTKPFRDVPFEIPTRGGAKRHFLVSGLPTFSPETGALTGVLGTARDVTVQRSAELALRGSEQRLQAIVGNVPVVLFALDRNGTFTLSEGKSLESLNLKPGELVGRSIFDVYRHAPEIIHSVRRALEGELVQSVNELKGLTFQFTFSPRRGENDEVCEVIGIAANITGRRKAQIELRESEERFHSLIEGSLLGVIIARDGKPMFANQACADIFGYGSPAEILRLESMDSLFHPQEIERIRTYRIDRMEGRPAPMRYEFRGRRKDGEAVIAEVQVRIVSWKGEPAIQSTLVDITEHKKMLEHLRHLSQAVEQSPASVIITDTTGAIQYVNEKFVQVTGYSADEVIGKNPRFLNSGQTPMEDYTEMYSMLRQGKEWRGEFLNRKKNGEEFWEYASISPIKGPDGNVTHYLAVKEDVTLRKEYERRLIQQANFDTMTGLPNRGLALDRLSQAVVRCGRDRMKVGLLFIDLDRFKSVNDTLGHATGDHVLREAGERIRNCLRAGDTVARLGGDEFTVILPGLLSGIDAEPVAQKILEAFTPAFRLNGREVFLSASIGITIWPDDAEDPDQLMGNADSAMYQAKDLGRNSFRFYTPELNERALTRARMENQIRHALERDEFELHYQPMVNLRSGQVVGIEALLRWRNVELGLVGPDEFIPLAEEIGLIAPIGKWVLQTACRQASHWKRLGFTPARISMNVSSRQFRGAALVETVDEILSTTDVDPQTLVLEITENLLMADIPEITRTMEALRKRGINLSVDDFGTGYSSLSYLRRFPVNALKIDKTFVQDATTDSDSAALVEAIIHMGRSLKLEVVAEGVETDAQMEFLRRRGCDIAQGYLFGKPLPNAQFMELIESWRPSTFFGPIGLVGR